MTNAVPDRLPCQINHLWPVLGQKLFGRAGKTVRRFGARIALTHLFRSGVNRPCAIADNARFIAGHIAGIAHAKRLDPHAALARRHQHPGNRQRPAGIIAINALGIKPFDHVARAVVHVACGLIIMEMRQIR